MRRLSQDLDYRSGQALAHSPKLIDVGQQQTGQCLAMQIDQVAASSPKRPAGDDQGSPTVGQLYIINPTNGAVEGFNNDMGAAATAAGHSDIGSISATTDPTVFAIQSNGQGWEATVDTATGQVSASGPGPSGHPDGLGGIYSSSSDWLLPSVDPSSHLLSIFGGAYGTGLPSTGGVPPVSSGPGSGGPIGGTIGGTVHICAPYQSVHTSHYFQLGDTLTIAFGPTANDVTGHDAGDHDIVGPTGVIHVVNGPSCSDVHLPTGTTPGPHHFTITDPATGDFIVLSYNVGSGNCTTNLVTDTFNRPNTGETASWGNEEGPCQFPWAVGNLFPGHDSAYDVRILNNYGFIGSNDGASSSQQLSPYMGIPISGSFTAYEGSDLEQAMFAMSFNHGDVIANMEWRGIYGDTPTLWLTINGVTTQVDTHPLDLSYLWPAGLQVNGPDSNPYDVSFSANAAGAIVITVAGVSFTAHSSEALNDLDAVDFFGMGSGGGGLSITDLSISGQTVSGSGDYLANSTLAVADSSLTAGDSTTVTLTVKDGNHDPVTNLAGIVSLHSTSGTFGAVIDHHNGTYTTTYTGTTAGLSTITALIGNDALSHPVTVTVATGAADPAQSHFDTNFGADPTSVTADGSSQSLITFDVTDAYGNPILSGAPVTFTTDLGTLSSSISGHSDGSYSATITSDTPGPAIIHAQVGGVTVTGSPATASVTFTADITSQSTITITPSSFMTAGDSVLVTVQLKDHSGADIHTSPGPLTLFMTQTPACVVTYFNCPEYYSLGTYLVFGSPPTMTATYIGDGAYTATFHTNTEGNSYEYMSVGTFNIFGSIGGNQLNHSAIITVSTGPVSNAVSTFHALTLSAPADGSSTTAVTVTALDSNGDVLVDDPSVSTVTVSTDDGHFASGCTADCTATNNHNGTYTATLTSPSSAGTANLSAKINGTAVTGGGYPQSVIFFAPPPPPPPSYPGNGDWTTVATTNSTSIANGDGVSLAYDAWVSADIGGVEKDFSWRILNAADAVVASGGPFNDTVDDSVSGHDFEIAGSTVIAASADPDTYRLQISLNASTNWYETPAASLTATPGPPAGTIVFPGYSYTVGSTDNALTAPFSVSAGDTVRVTLTAPPSDGGNIGVGCNSISYNDYRNSPGTRNYTFTGFGSAATDCVVYSWNSSSYRSGLSGAGSYAVYNGTVYLGDNSFFTVVNDQWGFNTQGGTYATACRLVGNTHVTFTASAPWTMDSYGGTHSAFTVDGSPMGYIDGGGSVTYTNGPFPAGAVDITESDGGSAHSDGGGGTSLCFTQAVVGP